MAIAVLLGVSAVGWWYWPRGDARFVGRWEMKKVGSDTPDAVVTFSRTGFVTSIPTGQAQTYTSPWRVEGNALVIGDNDEGVIAHACNSLSRVVSRLSIHQVSRGAGENWHRIITVSPDSFTLVDEFDDEPQVYRRIPE
ncbi:hypothetical protein AYO47_00225 [Planctomyces sp. SCGC AG-212-M04]|nr:hypothetical protein AYO47_00225 [Planctomyces sp. SCGC AG-212-M04]